MADGDIVRKITISATGENIDSTRKSVESLSAASEQYKKQTESLNTANQSTSWVDLAAKLYLVKSAYDAVTGATEGASDGVASAYNALKNVATDVVLAIPRAIGAEWERNNGVLKEYIELAGKAGAIGVSTDFYQRQIGAAETLKITNDSIIKQMDTLRSSTKDQLGGSTGQNRVDQLVSFGNFKGNTGVDELKNATTAEEKYTAVLSLIKQAQDAGERFAAIDVAKTMLGKDAADNLQNDAAYFDRMRVAGDKLKSDSLISDEDTSRALDLANRLQIAEETINKKWFPGQRDGLNPLVMYFKELWVSIVELVASAFTWVEKLVNKLLDIPSSIWNGLKDAYSYATTGFKQPEGPEVPGGVILSPMEQATSRMRTGLENPNTVSQAGRQTQSLSDQLRPDKSFPAKPTVPDAPDTASYDRAVESLRKYIETTNAASLSTDLTVDAQERLKAVAQLVAAGMKDGLSREVATLRANMNGLTTDAGAAALALAKARVESQINFGKNTSLLSPEDVAIAAQLKGLYPDVATALNSVQAAGIRTNTALSSLSGMLSGTLTTGLTDILDGTKSVQNGFADMSKIIIRAVEEMIVKLLIVGPLMRALQGGIGGFGGLFGGGSPSGYGANASGTDNWQGGLTRINEAGGEIVDLPNGTRIIPHDVSNKMVNGGGDISAPVTIHIDATGADPAGLARVEQRLAALQTSLPTTIVQTVQKATANRMFK